MTHLLIHIEKLQTSVSLNPHLLIGDIDKFQKSLSVLKSPLPTTPIHLLVEQHRCNSCLTQ